LLFKKYQKMKILHLISSPRNGASVSIKLGNAIVEELQSKYPGSNLTTHNLVTSSFPHLEEMHLTSFFTPPEARTPELTEAVKHSDEAIAELMEADVIVIGVPMYNFGIPSSLKAWIDHIMRAGITFKYSAAGAEGLVKNKKAYLAIASGGVYSDGPMKAADFSEPYLKSILNFIGITDVTTYRAEGLTMPDSQEKVLENAIAQVSV
jgi:FMN-dependent NADH-azoreductase